LTVSVPPSVIVAVGYDPISPLTVVVPALVMPAPARIAKVSVVPRGTDVAAAAAALLATASTTSNASRREQIDAGAPRRGRAGRA
jgi:hypothetical protein